MWKFIALEAARIIGSRLIQAQHAGTGVGGSSDSMGFSEAAQSATENLGRNLRQWGRQLGESADGPIGLPHAASFAAAQGLDKAGQYLEMKGFDGAVEDLGQQVRKHPLPFVAAGLIVGLALGRLVMARR